jgi:predicted nucleic acid-binding protein
MASRVEDVRTYVFTSEDKVFLDTNIWMLVFGPPWPKDKSRVSTYSGVFAQLLAAGCSIYIDALVVSEFVNAYARLRWNVAGKPHGDFKRFRQSSHFKPLAQDIASDARRVLKHCDRVESGFETVDIADVLNEFEAGDSDFNDQMLARICKTQGFKLLTDDGDFRGQDIPILTANQRLLR